MANKPTRKTRRSTKVTRDLPLAPKKAIKVKGGKPSPGPLNFEHYYDKSS